MSVCDEHYYLIIVFQSLNPMMISPILVRSGPKTVRNTSKDAHPCDALKVSIPTS